MPEAGPNNARVGAKSLIVTFSCSGGDARCRFAGRHEQPGEHRHDQRREMDRRRRERRSDDHDRMRRVSAAFPVAAAVVVGTSFTPAPIHLTALVMAVLTGLLVAARKPAPRIAA
jgi:hypothetical protein